MRIMKIIPALVFCAVNATAINQAAETQLTADQKDTFFQYYATLENLTPDETEALINKAAESLSSSILDQAALDNEMPLATCEEGIDCQLEILTATET